MSTVTFTPTTGPPVTVLLDEASPVITEGYGGWEVVDRPRRVGMTRFKGRDPFKQDISIMFDGYLDAKSQESRIANLERMAMQPHPTKEPPKIKISGHALMESLTWVIEGIDWDSDKVIWMNIGTNVVRVRQAAVVHLMQFVDDQIVTTAASPAVVAKDGGKKTTVPDGMTLKKLAQIEYGDPDAYMQIWMANRWLNPDPRAIIPPGTPVAIPAYKGHNPHTVWINTGNTITASP